MSNLLHVEKLSAGYGMSQVLFGVSLTVPRSGTVAVLGRNGAGKTTLLKCLAGELAVSSGQILLDSQPVHTLPAQERSRAGVGYVPQEQGVFAALSVRDNLLLGATGQGKPVNIDAALRIFPKLAQRLGQAAGTLSGGERKMLAIARALLGGPRVLMLDEPTEGVWVGVIEEIADRLRELSPSMGILLVEQHLELALGVADYVYVIDRGEIALHGPSEELRENPALIRLLAP